MRVILLGKVERLGDVGDEVEVRRGYARNFLIPRGLVIPAVRSGVELRGGESSERQRSAVELRADQMRRLGTVSVPSRVGRSGRLFGSVGVRDVARSISGLGVEVRRGEIFLPGGRIRRAGRYRVELRLGFGIRVTLALVVGAEDR